ncbi:MAG: O-antigen ligase family protein [Anaerolineae bacterium]|nr:O-antigen ligase family protein [Anaerolineae bacterium]
MVSGLFRQKLYSQLLILAAIPLAVIIGLTMNSDWYYGELISMGVFGGGLAILILIYPYWGLIISTASLLIIDVMPALPFVTSATQLMGGITFGSYLAAYILNRTSMPSMRLGREFNLMFLFVFWMMASNPTAATAPGNNDRVWLVTFAQLLLLLFLANNVLDSAFKQRVFIGIYALFVLITALFAILEMLAGADDLQAFRASGTAGGSNAAARYLTVGFVFLYYMYTKAPNFLVRLILLLAIGVVVLGLASTASRTGFLLLLVAVALFILTSSKGSQSSRFGLGILLLITASAFLFLPDTWIEHLSTISSSIEDNTDTVKLRSELWRSALNMWADNPVAGVGIGQFKVELESYAVIELKEQYYALGAHNMYLQILAETGMVGLFFFVSILLSALLALFRASRSANREMRELATIWLIVFIVLLSGGITKHDHYEKLIWLCVGVASYFDYFNKSSTRTVEEENASGPKTHIAAHNP